jgi:hypothetical protein
MLPKMMTLICLTIALDSVILIEGVGARELQPSLPSSNPSDQPSLIPSDAPSTTPSDVPSLVPSLSPTSECRSKKGAKKSSKLGKGKGVHAPSGVPGQSDGPSLVPSDSPSLAPSDEPSLMPSDAPSSVPSTVPSEDPWFTPFLRCGSQKGVKKNSKLVKGKRAQKFNRHKKKKLGASKRGKG